MYLCMREWVEMGRGAQSIGVLMHARMAGRAGGSQEGPRGIGIEREGHEEGRREHGEGSLKLTVTRERASIFFNLLRKVAREQAT